MNEETVIRNLRALAEKASEEAPPSAASMWWRLELRMRRERARQAQAPLIWMGRLLYAAVAILTVFLMAAMVDPSRPVLTIGILSLAALAVPVSVALWAWHRSSL